jgi:cell wall-associated NlpC family hydrolase
MSGHAPGKSTHIRRVLALVFIAGLLSLFASDTANAATTPAISQARSELQALSNLVDRLDLELEGLTEEYNYANQQYEDTQAAAEKTSADLAQAADDLLSAQNRLDERLVSIYKSGDFGTLDILLGAGSITELVTIVDGFNSIIEQDSQLVDEIAAYKTEQAELKAKLEADLKQLGVCKEQATAAREKVLDQVAKQKQALKGKEVQLVQLKKAEAERQARLAAEERARQAFLRTRPGKVIALAMQYLGVPYVWGGSTPKGFDCSGLVQYVYAKVGVALPHSSRMQFTYGTAVSRDNLRAGDLVFFFTPIQHVGIYIGNGKMINATGRRVQISDLFPNTFRGGRRVL